MYICNNISFHFPLVCNFVLVYQIEPHLNASKVCDCNKMLCFQFFLADEKKKYYFS